MSKKTDYRNAEAAIQSANDAGTNMCLTFGKWAWPVGAAAINRWRAMVRHGLARETTGECEGCEKHRSGTLVPTFEIL